MAFTITSRRSSHVGRRKVPVLAVVAALALMAAGCSDLYGQATDDARGQMGAFHAEAVGCLGRGMAAQPGLDGARRVTMPCTKTPWDGDDPGLFPASYQPGSWLLSINYDDTEWTLEVVDVGYAVRYQGEAENHRAVIQCWTTTLDFESSTMTDPSRVACPADIENSVVGHDAREESHLVTSAPSK